MLFCNINSSINELRGIEFECIGTEVLLLALSKLETSVFNYILKANNIDNYLLKKNIKSCLFFRKSEYTKKYNEVIETSENIAALDESDLIYDEHLLYALLLIKDTISSNVETVIPRLDGVVGLYLLIPILFFHSISNCFAGKFIPYTYSTQNYTCGLKS